jgi:hypothetical protein
MAITQATRRLVLQRAGERCEYCLIEGWPLTVDHVVPVAAWSARRSRPPPPGVDRDHPDNLCAACWLCNRAKSDATSAHDSVTNTEQRLSNPRVDRWHEHFRWSADSTTIDGVTPIGRATVALMRLNRAEYQLQRRLLRAAMRGGGPAWP